MGAPGRATGATPITSTNGGEHLLEDKSDEDDDPLKRLLVLPLEQPCRDPVGHRLASWPVGDLVGDQAPPIALLADSPAGEPILDDRVHLQSGRVVAAG